MWKRCDCPIKIARHGENPLFILGYDVRALYGTTLSTGLPWWLNNYVVENRAKKADTRASYSHFDMLKTQRGIFGSTCNSPEFQTIYHVLKRITHFLMFLLDTLKPQFETFQCEKYDFVHIVLIHVCHLKDIFISIECNSSSILIIKY